MSFGVASLAFRLLRTAVVKSCMSLLEIPSAAGTTQFLRATCMAGVHFDDLTFSRSLSADETVYF